MINELYNDLRSPRMLPGLSAGMVIGLMAVVIQVSFSSMIFSGPLSIHVSSGIGMLLAGQAVLVLISSLASRIPTLVAMPQDAPVALYAGAAASIAAVSTNPESPETFITIAAGLLLSALMTGFLFFLIGSFKLADLVRFMPYPVISGFMAGTGWLLAKGSLEVMTGLPLEPASLSAFFTVEQLILWVPGIAFALALFLLMRRYSHFLILPGSIAAVVLLYYLVFWAADITVPQAKDMGILYHAFSEASLWPAYRPEQFLDVDWHLIFAQLPAIAVIPFISLIGMLLNTGGIELAARKEYDINRELKVNGAANLLAAFAGASPGYSVLSFSTLGLRIGADTRLVGLTVSLLSFVTLIFGSSILSLFPRPILGGFLLLLGLFFIFDWLIDTSKKMPRSDHILVLLIFLVISVFGYLQGVLFGLLMATLFFVIRFSRVSLIQSQGNLSQKRSSRVRSLPQQILLTRHGHKAQVYSLSGYIFFGSASALVRTVSDTAAQQGETAEKILILDFRDVNGFDISSINQFIRLINRIAGQGVHFVFSEPPDGFEVLLRQNIHQDLGSQIRFFESNEQALQWAEDWIIAEESQLMNNSSEAGHSMRDDLFESAYDDMLMALENQGSVENLIDTCLPYLAERSYEKDFLLLEQGKPAEGIFLVRSGVVVEKAERGEHQILMRELGPGSVFSELAAYRDVESPYSYWAKTDVQVCILDPDALRRIEQHLPATAHELHRLVIKSLL